MAKKASELSINFLVIFIFSIVIFSLGIILMWKIFFGGTDMVGDISGEFDRRILALNCVSSQTVCVGANQLNIKSGEKVLIDVVIFNNHNFDITHNLEFELRDSENNFFYEEFKILPPRYVDEVINAKDKRDFSVLLSTERRFPHGVYSLRIITKRQQETSLGRQNLEDIIRRIDISVS